MKKMILIPAFMLLATSAWADGDKKEHWVHGKATTQAEAIGETEIKAAAKAKEKGTCYETAKPENYKEEKDKHWVCKTIVEKHKDKCDSTKVIPH